MLEIGQRLEEHRNAFPVKLVGLSLFSLLHMFVKNEKLTIKMCAISLCNGEVRRMDHQPRTD